MRIAKLIIISILSLCSASAGAPAQVSTKLEQVDALRQQALDIMEEVETGSVSAPDLVRMRARAQAIAKRAVCKAESRFGSRHIETARSLVVQLQTLDNGAAEALPMADRAFEIAQAALAPTDPEIMNYYMGRALFAGTHPQMEPRWQDMLDAAERVFDRDVEKVSKYRALLTAFYLENGRMEEAQRLDRLAR